MNIIDLTHAMYASPVALEQRKDGTLRFCFGYRKLSAVTAQDSYPLPQMDECQDSLEHVLLSSTLHEMSSYGQIQVNESDKKKNIFIFHLGVYQFTQLFYGSEDAPMLHFIL